MLTEIFLMRELSDIHGDHQVVAESRVPRQSQSHLICFADYSAAAGADEPT